MIIIFVFIIFLIIVLLALSKYLKKSVGMTYVKSDIDDELYLVRYVSDKQQASNTLARIKQYIIQLADELYNNKHEKHNKEYIEYIDLLHSKIRHIVIVESTEDSAHTSYSVNKGEQIVFCLRSRKDKNNLHDINMMMYVVLHEISHVACPIYDNHGPLFRKIFAFITQSAIDYGIYKKIDFQNEPKEYCGLTISESII